MIYFIHGEDSYRSKRKLEEIVFGYKEKHKSGLNLIYADAEISSFKDFYSNLKITSMFAEKKLVVLENTFDNVKFQEEFLSALSGPALGGEDIIVVYEDRAPDQRTKFFKELQKHAKCQEFNYLNPAKLREWVAQEFKKRNVKINPDALGLLVEFVKNDLWQMANEVAKLSNYKAGGVVEKKDVELLIKPGAESDIFETIDAIASKNRKVALSLIKKHIDGGEVPLYLLSMIAYQFRNLLIIKELQEKNEAYPAIVKKSGLHPFVVQKSFYLCNQFSMEELKKVYQRIFQADLDIKTGKIEPETALDLLLSAI